jgi:hypothetical protein
MEASRNGIGEDTVSKSDKKGKEANPYDEVDYWIWPNRRIDLNYASLDVSEVAELDRRVEGLGFSGAGLREISEAWFKGGCSDPALSHAWHLARAGLKIGDCLYETWPFGMDHKLFAATGFDAWSGPLYTEFCSIAELHRIFVPAVIGIKQWLNVGLGRLDRGVSEKEFTFRDRGSLVKVQKHFDFVCARAIEATADSWDIYPGGALDDSWNRLGGWSDIYAFVVGARGWLAGVNRLKRLALNRGERREANKMLNVVGNVGGANYGLVRDISFEACRLFHDH